MKRMLTCLLALCLALFMLPALAEVSLPIVEEPVTYTAFAVMDFDIYKDNLIFEDFQKDTGVNFDIAMVSGSNYGEKFNLLMAGNDLPDVVFSAASMNTSLLQKHTATGAFIDLADLIKENMPNLTAMMDANPAIAQAITLPDGTIASLPYMNMAASNGECPNYMFYINTAWLETLGLAAPTNTDELYDLLCAFRDDDPNGNGLKDEIPLVGGYGVDGLRKMSVMFGTMLSGSTAVNLFVEDGKVVYVPVTEEYKAFVKYLNKLYADGLISSDFFTLSGEQITSIGQGESEVYGVFNANWDVGMVGAEYARDYDALAPFEVNGKYYIDGRTYANPGMMEITSACEDPATLLKWADIFYDAEYGKIAWMGVEGLSYAYNEDGTWNWLYTDEHPDTLSVRKAYTFQNYRGLWVCPADWFKLNDSTEMPVNQDRENLALNYPGACRTAMPTLYYSDDAEKEMSLISTDLNSYESEMFVSFIIGAADIDAQWDSFCQTLENMGASQLVSLAQDAYDNR